MPKEDELQLIDTAKVHRSKSRTTSERDKLFHTNGDYGAVHR
jgi:hypothetical protein